MSLTAALGRYQVTGYTAGPPALFCVVDIEHPLRQHAPWYSPIVSFAPFLDEKAAQAFADECNAKPPHDIPATLVRDRDGTVIRVERK